uniref:Cyclic GMP-AMP synthase n=1 Tax=Salvator merianae TaxID=96440 RepID=A0A8D0C2N5_SALMN
MVEYGGASGGRGKDSAAPLVKKEAALGSGAAGAAATAAAPATRRRSGRQQRNDEAARLSCPAGSEAPLVDERKGCAKTEKDAAPSRRSSQKKKEGAPQLGKAEQTRGQEELQIISQLKEAEGACEELQAPRGKTEPVVRRKCGSRKTKAPPVSEEEEEEEATRRLKEAEGVCEDLEPPRGKAKPVARRKSGSQKAKAPPVPEEEEEATPQREQEVACEGRRRSRQPKGARALGGERDGPAGLGETALRAKKNKSFQVQVEAEDGTPTKEGAMVVASVRKEPSSVDLVLKRVLDKLRLTKQDISEASRRVAEVTKNVIAAVTELFGCRVERLGTGSYYEHVKVCNPNEFDIMLIIQDVRLELEPCCGEAASGAFYYIKLANSSGRSCLRRFLNDEEQLSSSKLLRELRRTIADKVRKMEGENIRVQKSKATSPAITILLGTHPSDISIDFTLALECKLRPKLTKDGLDITKWLGTKVRKEFNYGPWYFVPKTLKDGTHLIEDTWRLSFSHFEKSMINNHGNTKTCCEVNGEKCCRKNCLKLLKYLLEQLKEKHKQRNQFDSFFSYHAKTAFFHACSKWPKDDEWKKEDLARCFVRFLRYFLDCLRKTELQHFFIPEFNFFCASRIRTGKCAILARVIEQEINNGFPILE